MCLCVYCVMHESTTPETVTMKRNGLCDTCRNIVYTHTYHILLLGRTRVFSFKALSATSLYAGTKCAKIKETHKHEFPLMLKPVA